jgi:hypothetical protein
MQTLLFYSRHLQLHIAQDGKSIVHYHKTATSTNTPPKIPVRPTTTLLDPLELVV